MGGDEIPRMLVSYVVHVTTGRYKANRPASYVHYLCIGGIIYSYAALRERRHVYMRLLAPVCQMWCSSY